MSSEIIPLKDAVEILRKELHYSEERALKVVKTYDHNNDGKLSADEITKFKKMIKETKALLLQKFREYDEDGSGSITLQEATTILKYPPYCFPPSRILFLLSKFDKDKNGKLDIHEFAEFFAEAKASHDEVSKLFSSLDTDKNGVLSPDEVVGIIQDRLGFDREMALHMIKMFDTNNDGDLDKTEFMEMWSSIFGH